MIGQCIVRKQLLKPTTNEVTFDDNYVVCSLSLDSSIYSMAVETKPINISVLAYTNPFRSYILSLTISHGVCPNTWQAGETHLTEASIIYALSGERLNNACWNGKVTQTTIRKTKLLSSRMSILLAIFKISKFHISNNDNKPSFIFSIILFATTYLQIRLKLKTTVLKNSNFFLNIFSVLHTAFWPRDALMNKTAWQ